ncbi:MAG: hypothetical protein CMJ32_09710 [Phycisphaerae bacterium]|nr:hypothetical protein [Phycisphaerae bacterium]
MQEITIGARTIRFDHVQELLQQEVPRSRIPGTIMYRACGRWVFPTGILALVFGWTLFLGGIIVAGWFAGGMNPYLLLLLLVPLVFGVLLLRSIRSIWRGLMIIRRGRLVEASVDLIRRTWFTVGGEHVHVLHLRLLEGGDPITIRCSGNITRQAVILHETGRHARVLAHPVRRGRIIWIDSWAEDFRVDGSAS